MESFLGGVGGATYLALVDGTVECVDTSKSDRSSSRIGEEEDSFFIWSCGDGIDIKGAWNVSLYHSLSGTFGELNGLYCEWDKTAGLSSVEYFSILVGNS